MKICFSIVLIIGALFSAAQGLCYEDSVRVIELNNKINILIDEYDKLQVKEQERIEAGYLACCPNCKDQKRMEMVEDSLTLLIEGINEIYYNASIYKEKIDSLNWLIERKYEKYGSLLYEISYTGNASQIVYERMYQKAIKIEQQMDLLELIKDKPIQNKNISNKEQEYLDKSYEIETLFQKHKGKNVDNIPQEQLDRFNTLQTEILLLEQELLPNQTNDY